MRNRFFSVGIFLTVIFLPTASIFAAPPALTLSKSEIQKLQQYFPDAEPQKNLLNNSADSTPENSSLVWQGNPLTLSLPLNQEKRLIFPMKVLPDLKGALTTAQLRILNDNQSLYLTALQPFAKTRLFVTLEKSHEVVLIDLVTSAAADNAPVSIAIKQNNNNSSGMTTQTIHNTPAVDNNSPTAATADDIAITLLRFAWQQLYAPQRLLTNPLGINRTAMHTDSLLSTLIYGDKVYAHPLASWVYQNTYITALVLRNKYPHAATIHLSQDVCGQWQAASLYPRRHLKPAGDKNGDSTVLFLISPQPFAQSMEICHGSA